MKALVIAVHPDDETLGCGGTLLKHRDNKDETFWLIMTNVDGNSNFSEEYGTKRTAQIKQVAEAYNFKETFTLGFPTTQLHTVDFREIINQISSVIQKVKPEIIYTINRSDVHTDHQVTARAVFSCTKSFRNTFIKRLMMYETLSETEIAPPLPENLFIPNVFSDISGNLEEKLEIMKLYESEVQEEPLPRSIENIKSLARYRGSSVAVKYAESFMLVRELF